MRPAVGVRGSFALSGVIEFAGFTSLSYPVWFNSRRPHHDNVVTAAMLQRYAKYGIDFSVRRGECFAISKLDAQRGAGKTVYGGGLLVSSQKAIERAAERAAAERAAAHVWQLSDREREMVLELDSHGSQ